MDTHEYKFTPIFTRIWKGDEGLAKTYWIYGVVVGGLLGFLLSLAMATGEHTISIVFTLLSVAHIVFIGVSIWRASDRYNGSTVWSFLAKIAVLIPLTIFSFFIIQIALRAADNSINDSANSVQADSYHLISDTPKTKYSSLILGTKWGCAYTLSASAATGAVISRYDYSEGSKFNPTQLYTVSDSNDESYLGRQANHIKYGESHILTLSSDESFAYVAGQNNIADYTVSPTCLLYPIDGPELTTSGVIVDLAKDLSGSFIFALIGSPENAIHQYRIRKSGALEFISSAHVGHAPKRINFDRNGKNLYIGHVDDGAIYRFAIAPNGLLAKKAAEIYVTGFDASNASIDPSGKYLYVSEGFNRPIKSIRLSSDGKILREFERIIISNAFHGRFAFHPNGKHAYAADEKNGGLAIYDIGNDGINALSRREVSFEKEQRGNRKIWLISRYCGEVAIPHLNGFIG